MVLFKILIDEVNEESLLLPLFHYCIYMLLHQYYIQDDSLRRTGDYTANTGIEIYEVIRVIQKIPLFLEDHLKRFYYSAWLCHQEIPLREETIASRLATLIEANETSEGNIRFSWCFRPAGNFQAYFIPHHYPSQEEVNRGIDCGILKAERSSPNAKVVQANLRESADRMIREHGYYEVLLLNHKSEFTEGSRSNLFFLRRGAYITSPSADILPGITRQKVLDLLYTSGKPVVKRNLGLEELPGVEAVFITGTSPRILPVRRIEDRSFKTDLPGVRTLIERYNQVIGHYIEEKQGLGKSPGVTTK